MDQTTWTLSKKISFRFFFLWVILTTIFAYNPIFTLVDSFTSLKLNETFYGIFSPFVFWFDQQVTHIGYTLNSFSYFGDFMFGWIMLVAISIAALVGTALWSLLDRKRLSYSGLLKGFRIYVCYYLFQAMIIYAMEKIIPVQMSFPSIGILLSPLHELSKFDLVWSFMGVSPIYSTVTGFVELFACTMILFRRTRAIGSLLMVMALVNVCCFNYFYGVPVKLLSGFLFVCSLFIAAEYATYLYQFFWKHEKIALPDSIGPDQGLQKWISIGLFILAAWLTIYYTQFSWNFRQKTLALQKQEKLYTVDIFSIKGDTLPPLLTDSVRLRRLAFTGYRGQKFALTYNMQDQPEAFDFAWDSKRKQVALTSFSDTTQHFTFSYTDSTNKNLSLAGKWKGNEVTMKLSRVAIDSLNLVREKFRLIRDN